MLASLRWILLLLMFGAAFAAPAQEEGARIRDTIAALNAEQQSVYQQFQMLQNLRNQSLDVAHMPQAPGPPRDYDEVLRERQDAADAANRYQGDMDALYTRYKALEDEKQPLLERMRELALQPPPDAPPPPSSARPRSARPYAPAMDR